MNAELQFLYLDSISEIAAKNWNALVNSAYPFMRHEFLQALETSGCTSAESGWKASHLLVKNDSGDLLALMPLYLKNHSMGEYVFDWSWADAYYRHGLNYYPKFLTAIPFTPSSGPRICIARGQDEKALLQVIMTDIQQRAASLGASSWHVLFPDKQHYEMLKDLGMQQRLGCQYQWFNKGYSSFDDFLQSFASRKRKNINKERRRIKDSAIEFECLEGREITTEHWQHFYRFYQNTYLVRGRSAYLNLPFFMEIGRLMPENLVLIMAKKEQRYIAGALSFKDEQTLYGRYWGCDQEWEFLHFETCYYQGLDYCIAQGLQRFDSGAQGEHKIQRGFEPVETYSNHWISHPEFSAAIEQFLEEEKQHLTQYQRLAEKHLPYKKR